MTTPMMGGVLLIFVFQRRVIAQQWKGKTMKDSELKECLNDVSAISAMIGYCQSLERGTVITSDYIDRLNDYYVPNLQNLLDKIVQINRTQQSPVVNAIQESLINVLKKLQTWVTQEPSQPSSPDAQQWVRHYIEEALSLALIIEKPIHPTDKSPSADEVERAARAIDSATMNWRSSGDSTYMDLRIEQAKAAIAAMNTDKDRADWERVMEITKRTYDCAFGIMLLHKDMSALRQIIISTQEATWIRLFSPLMETKEALAIINAKLGKL